MVLHRILHALVNNAQLVEKLAESGPVRRAAQLTVFAVRRAQLCGRDTAARFLRSDTPQRVARLRQSFMRELQQGMRDAARQIKEKK